MIIKVKGREIEIRALTRGEIKGLRDYGYTYMGCKTPTLDTANDCQDEALKIVVSSDDLEFLDTRPLRDATCVWTEILKETYGAQDEEKNSSGTSDGSQTKSE